MVRALPMAQEHSNQAPLEAADFGKPQPGPLCVLGLLAERDDDAQLGAGWTWEC